MGVSLSLRRSLLAAASVLACAPLSGCVANTDSVAANEDDIIGGTSDNVDRSVVAISVWNQQVSHTCSATVVSPHVVVTAAHCVDPGDVGVDNVVQVFMGDTLASPWPWLYKSVKEVHVPPNYDSGNIFSGNDIAVVITKSALGRPALPMNRVALGPSDVGRSIRFVGFGKTAANNPDSYGRRYQASLSITSVSSKFVSSSSANSFTCQGDSGGPGFIKRSGVEYIAGINSFGPANCNGANTSTRVDAFAQSFVDGYIHTFDPGFQAP